MTGRLDTEQTDCVREQTAESLESAADSVRSAGKHGAAALSDLANGAGGKLDTTAAYVRAFEGEDLVTELRHTIRRHPIASLALGAAIGLIAGFVCRRGGSEN